MKNYGSEKYLEILWRVFIFIAFTLGFTWIILGCTTIKTPEIQYDLGEPESFELEEGDMIVYYDTLHCTKPYSPTTCRPYYELYDEFGNLIRHSE